jgi:AraC family transcriptional regulator of adaptative response/methylated-DNA-[protein]-cysteine methyltransferase
MDDRRGLCEIVGKLEHLLDHPDQDPGIVLDMRGSAYQKQVWTLLREIPAGETTNYEALAARLGTRDARDVTEAIGSNSIAIPIPRPYVRGVKVVRPRAKLNRGLLWIGQSRAPNLSEGEP